MALLMNRHNANKNAFAVQHLELAPSDHVLEIGFGGGATLPSLLTGAWFVAGIDPSTEMVKRAKNRHAVAVTAGRAEFRTQVRIERPQPTTRWNVVVATR